MRKWLPMLVAMVLLGSAIPACAPAAAPAPATKAQESTAAKAPASEAKAAAPAPKAQDSTALKAPAPDSKAPAKPLEKVVIAIPVDGPDYLPLRMGIEKGIYKEEGLDPQIVVLKGELELPAMLKGDLDYISVLSRSLAGSILGEPVKLVMGRQMKGLFHYILAPGLTSPDQMKGKNIAVTTKGGIEHYGLILTLKRFGLDADKDVTMLPIPTYPEQLAALKSGAISMAGLQGLESYMAIKAGMKEILFGADAFDLPNGGMGTTVKKIQENRDQVKRVAKAFLRGMAYARDHKDESIAYYVKNFKMEQDAAESIYGDEVRTWSYDGSVSEEGLQNQQGIWKTFGGPTKDATMEQIKAGIAYDVIQDVQKELGLAK